MMNPCKPEWDTPPRGDFARYVERLVAEQAKVLPSAVPASALRPDKAGRRERRKASATGQGSRLPAPAPAPAVGRQSSDGGPDEALTRMLGFLSKNWVGVLVGLVLLYALLGVGLVVPVAAGLAWLIWGQGDVSAKLQEAWDKLSQGEPLSGTLHKVSSTKQER